MIISLEVYFSSFKLIWILPWGDFYLLIMKSNAGILAHENDKDMALHSGSGALIILAKSYFVKFITINLAASLHA
jgi:hypothetical protein